MAIEKASLDLRWMCTLDQRLPFGMVLVAIANRHARQIWGMLTRDVDYDPYACLAHPMHRKAGAA